jgi:hypothetical protein
VQAAIYPQASISTAYVSADCPAVGTHRIFDPVTGLNVNCRQTLLLPDTVQDGIFTHVDPFQ